MSSASSRSTDPHKRVVRDETAAISNRLFSTPEGASLLNGGRLGFVSPRDSGPCAVLARDMAAHLARRQRTIAIVEMDVRAPNLAAACGQSGADGWTDRRSDPNEPWSAHPASDNLVLVPAGNTRTDPLAVDNRVLENVLRGLSPHIDLTLVTLPPLLDAPESLTLLAPLDQVVLAIPAGKIRTKDLRRTKDLLASSGTRLAGSVLTDAKYPLPSLLTSLL